MPISFDPGAERYLGTCFYDVAKTITPGTAPRFHDAVAVDVWNQTIDGDIAATVTAAVGGANTSGCKVLAAGFSFGQSAKARTLGWQKEMSPTLRGGEGGNQKPCIYQVSNSQD